MVISSDAVIDACRYFDRWLAFRQRYERVPGVQAAVWFGDGLVLSSAHGVADESTGVALTDRHLFRIASHSKTFTATAVMQLVERDELRLDDPVGRHLPWLAGTGIEQVTLRELLSHAGGIVRDGWDGDFWQLDHAFPDADGLRQLCADHASVIPRNDRFKYSNVGYSLLGQVIEVVTGHSYAAHVRAHVIEPLGLRDTGPDLDPTRADELAAGHSSLAYADRRLAIEQVSTHSMDAATGFWSTASDVVRYASAHFLGDERLISDESKRQMQRTEWEVEGTGGTGYGLGFAVSTIGARRLVGHGGGFPGHITRTFLDPVDRLAVSVLTNAIDGPALALATAGVRLIDLASAADATEPVGTGGSATSRIDLGSFEGRFGGLWGVFDIVALGGRLHQIDPTQPDPVVGATRLEVVDERTLRIASTSGYGSYGEPIAYERAPDGAVVSIRGGSGSTASPIDRLAEAVAVTDRVTLGRPLAPA